MTTYSISHAAACLQRVNYIAADNPHATADMDELFSDVAAKLTPVHFRSSQPPRRSHSVARSILVWLVRSTKAVAISSL